MKLIKQILKKILIFANKVFSKFGFLVVPIHYYLPITNITKLNKKKKLFKPASFEHINYNHDESIKFFKSMKNYINESKESNNYHDLVKSNIGPGYGYIESIVLNAFLRTKKPKKIIEIGSGISTALILDSLNKNEQKFEFWSIDPYPKNNLLKYFNIQNCRLSTNFVEDLDVQELVNFQPDFLFIDSTHAVKPLGDVEFIYTRLLPMLSKISITIHDITFPYLYQSSLRNEPFFQWCEAQMLYCYLLNNSKSKLLLSLPHIFHDKKNKIFSEIFDDWKEPLFDDGFKIQSRGDNTKIFFPSSVYLLQ